VTAAIQIANLSKTFRRSNQECCALADVCLQVQPGEMVALIGASGSGKSTLIRHMVGLTVADREPSTGTVRMLGETVQAGGRLAPRARAVRVRVGVIFQDFNLVGRLSLLTNVMLGRLGRMPIWRCTLGRFSRQEKLQAMAALHRLGIHQHATQRASTLSGGQQQRGAIARALVQEADIVLADEPIASLDPEAARRVMEDLARINREDGITVVVSLHQVDFAVRYCERTVALRDGRIVFDGASEKVTPQFLRKIYGSQCEELILQGPLRESTGQRARPRRLDEAAWATG
jgi:phosphonate transport system ATP-binding protein